MSEKWADVFKSDGARLPFFQLRIALGVSDTKEPDFTASLAGPEFKGWSGSILIDGNATVIIDPSPK